MPYNYRQRFALEGQGIEAGSAGRKCLWERRSLFWRKLSI